MSPRVGKLVRWSLLPICILVLATATHAHWLPWFAEALIRTDPPQKADIIVVLAGDGWGQRILKAAELASQGLAPQVLVDGPDGNYEAWECDLAIDFAERHGYPRSMFIRFPMHALSTREEAALVIPALRARSVQSFILVTSHFHTRRAGKIFRENMGDMRMMVVASPTRFYTPSTWWTHREGRKAIFTEWAKTVTTPFGI